MICPWGRLKVRDVFERYRPCRADRVSHSAYRCARSRYMSEIILSSEPFTIPAVTVGGELPRITQGSFPL